MKLNLNIKKNPQEKNPQKEANQNTKKEQSGKTPPKEEKKNVKKADLTKNFKEQERIKKEKRKQEQQRYKELKKMELKAQAQYEAAKLNSFRNWSILLLLACLFFGIQSFRADYLLAGIVSLIQALSFLINIIICTKKVHIFNKDYLILFLIGIFLTPLWFILAII